VCGSHVARKNPGMFEAGGIPGPSQYVGADFPESAALLPGYVKLSPRRRPGPKFINVKLGPGLHRGDSVP